MEGLLEGENDEMNFDPNAAIETENSQHEVERLNRLSSNKSIFLKQLALAEVEKKVASKPAKSTEDSLKLLLEKAEQYTLFLMDRRHRQVK